MTSQSLREPPRVPLGANSYAIGDLRLRFRRGRETHAERGWETHAERGRHTPLRAGTQRVPKLLDVIVRRGWLMLRLRRPSESEILQYLQQQQSCPFSYSAVGATRGAVPAGFQLDRHRVRLGTGHETFVRARQAIRSWQMFPVEMTKLYWPDRPIEEGVVVAVQIRVGLLWTLNPCRIVYTMDQESEVAVFGFAYGTLPDHMEQGEERFQVEWNRNDDSVWYDLMAFSRPRHPLARLGYFYARFLQARFRRLSGQAMERATKGVGE